MSVTLPNGSIISIASGYASAKTMTAVTNASPGVASVTANGYSNGDLLEVTSGWSKLTNRIVRVSGAATDAVNLEGIDTTLTSLYPAAGGAGSVRKITGWTQLQQILNTSSSGGDQQFGDYQFLEADSKVRFPTFKNPVGIAIDVADDPTLAGYLLASVANNDRLPRAIKIALPNGSFIYHNAYVSLTETPSLTQNQPMAVQVTLSMLNAPVRYAS